MAGVVGSGEDVQNVRERGTVKTDAGNSFFALWGKSHTAISVGIAPVCSSLGLLPVTNTTAHQRLALLSALWTSAGSAEMFR